MLGSDIHVKQPTFKSRFRRWPTLVALLLFRNGCVLHQSLHEQAIGDFGRFVFHASDSRSDGFVIGVPHGSVEPEATDCANALSDATGAGLVITYGFSGNRILVAQPLIHSSPISCNTTNFPRPVSAYPGSTTFLRVATAGSFKFYVGVRIADEARQSSRIEVASAGFSFEQLIALKHTYGTIQNETIKEPSIPRIELALNPLENISWNAFGVKNHGVLMLTEKGLTAYRNIRVQLLREEPQTPKVNLIIEPVDQLPIGALAAKEHGILRLARRSLHFELPAQHVFYRENARRAYTKMFAELIQSITSLRSESKVAGLVPYFSLHYVPLAQQILLDHDRALKKNVYRGFGLCQTEYEAK